VDVNYELGKAFQRIPVSSKLSGETPTYTYAYMEIEPHQRKTQRNYNIRDSHFVYLYHTGIRTRHRDYYK